ncbi:DNA-binding response regulator [Flavobacterium album]|uniref:DNA-binding response regulator n=1 Tax=Flavobacterium album TaxID=2175091 RepID=A0A2S1R0X3_9FLAO|nr:LytTR family DNA-binding domain-containing protein [Flavobacterium album]AWH86353.1 DNA-binding response regulator [Flavobacterium album]
MNVVIVEDEQHTARLLHEIIESNEGFTVIQHLESIAEAVAYLACNSTRIDLLFFDIQLSDGKSFEIFKHVDITIPVIFCTAYDEFSLQAIQNNGINYILKPFRAEEIAASLDKYKKLFLQTIKTRPLQMENELPTAYQQNFLTQYRGRTIIKSVEEIAAFCIEFETVYLYTFKNEKSPLYKNLEYIDSVCDPGDFFRINRKMLINKKAIKSFEALESRKVVLNLTISIEYNVIVSRLKVPRFKKWLQQ